LTPLLRAELLKLRTTRTFAALVGASLALSLLVVALVAAIGDDLNEKDVRDLFTADFSSLFILLLGVIGMAGEWRHKTITSTVLVAPNRLQLLAAKTLSYALAGALLSLIITVVIMGVGTVILAGRGETTIGLIDLADVLWRNLVVAGLLGALGVCVGGLLRSQVVAIVGLLVFAFAVEPSVLAVADQVGRFGPTGALPGAIQETEPIDDATLLAPGIALLVMLAWVGSAFAATAVVLQRRDLI
jgi:ABC-2 type transport system permease protein